MENIIEKIKEIEKLVCKNFEDLEIDTLLKMESMMIICLFVDRPTSR